MNRIMIYLILALLLFGTTLPPLWADADAFEDNWPLTDGMHLSFQGNGPPDFKNRLWRITVMKTAFPKSLTYTWLRIEAHAQTNGTRILTDLQDSRDFNPRFEADELISTQDTAPWLSAQILKELREYGVASDFREGGSEMANWKASTLKKTAQILFPVALNGKAKTLHAFRVGKGMVVWNNPQNPLMLEYEPLGIPPLPNVVGWRLRAIDFQ
jgi:hypothetical protein